MPSRHKLRKVFQDRLKEARTKANLSQRSLGIKAGMHADSASPRMNRYEKGIYEPDLETLHRLAIALEVPASFLIADDDDIARVILLLGKQSSTRRAFLLRLLKKHARISEE